MLDPEEIVLAQRVLSKLDQTGSPGAQASGKHVKRVIDQLVRLRQVVLAYPSILRSREVAGELLDVHRLTDTICSSNPYTIEALMPTRAVVGRAYLVAKFNFFDLLVKIVGYHLRTDDPEREKLLEEASGFVLPAVFVVIAEDILVSIASDQEQEVDIRKKATFLLEDLWEHRTSRSVRDFFPLVESVWSAKTRVKITYGTLSGTTEILSLLREGCEPEVIDYFTREHILEGERQALLELVFNSTYEELETMRTWMKSRGLQVMGPEDVARLFNIPVSRLHQTITTPKDMFFTFRERQSKAHQRMMQKLPGPHKTAEEYLMIYFLAQTAIEAPSEKDAEEFEVCHEAL